MIHFTHNDLDALGCMLCVNTKYTIDRVYHTYYGDFDEVANKVSLDTDKILIITDLSFSERPQTLKKLIESKDLVILIDHHSYPEGYWDTFNYGKKFKCIVNTEHCASTECYSRFKLQNENLKYLLRIINVYDIWLDTAKEFDDAQRLNRWFWESDINTLCDIIMNNDYCLPREYLKQSQDLLDVLYTKLDVLRTNCVKQCGLVTFIFEREYFNELMIEEHKKGTPFVVGVCDGIYKVRINRSLNLCNADLDKLRMMLLNRITGHPYAFTYKVNTDAAEECKRIVSVIMEFTKDCPEFIW